LYTLQAWRKNRAISLGGWLVAYLLANTAGQMALRNCHRNFVFSASWLRTSFPLRRIIKPLIFELNFLCETCFCHFLLLNLVSNQLAENVIGDSSANLFDMRQTFADGSTPSTPPRDNNDEAAEAMRRVCRSRRSASTTSAVHEALRDKRGVGGGLVGNARIGQKVDWSRGQVVRQPARPGERMEERWSAWFNQRRILLRVADETGSTFRPREG